MLRLVSKNGGVELPVTLADMAQHLRREDTAEDDEYIEACLLSAIEWAERFTGLVMIDQTWDYYTDAFPALATSAIYLRRGPILEVESVNYRDVSGSEIELSTSSYSVDDAGGIFLPMSGTWPDTDGALNAVRVRFRVGYIDMTGSPEPDGDIPDMFKAAIKLCAASLYGQREDDPKMANTSRVPYGAEMLLRHYRIDDSLA